MKNIDEAYILDYIRRKLPPEEMQKCDALIVSSPEFREKVEELRKIWNISENIKAQKRIDTEKAWNSVSGRIAFASFQSKLWNTTRTAAAILLPLFIIYHFLTLPDPHSETSEIVTMSSAPGIITKIVLSDGSEVWLNGLSELTYPAHFTDEERKVSVSGEVYFKVVADPERRFDVYLKDGTMISAFGTEFNINAYEEDVDIQVTLASGHIDVVSPVSAKTEKLIAGEKVTLAKETGIMTVTKADTYAETAWKDGKLVFRRENFDSFAQKLSRKFGVKIRLEDEELKKYEYTATFVGESLEEILYLLQRSAPVTYTITEQDASPNHTLTPRIITFRSKK